MLKKDTYSLHNIQMLRAFAAMLVVLHHTYPHYEAMGGNSYIVKVISQWGFLGVDIFFVISGFIMAYTTFNKERTFKNAKIFFKHRLFRIYLGYWPFFLIMFVLIVVTNPQQLDTLDAMGSFFLYNTDMFQLVLPVSWSLSYELYFYVLFLLTFIFSIKKLYIIIPVFTSVILLMALYSFFDQNTPDSFFYSPFLLEFFSGVLLYMYKKYIMKLWVLPIIVGISLAAYIYGIHYELKNGLLRIATFGTGAFTIAWFAITLEENNIFRAGKYFIKLGDASYTLYLSHLIILSLFYFLGLRDLFTSDNTILPLLGLIAILLLCIVFSLMYYKYVERPLYKKAISHSFNFFRILK